mmetsp:Transcript_108507/g.305834  ORF Transcript_108507/g.305834 Transcript_108507/m.305834 type:complete len:353 (-) Transcript_108507:98-1156(-)|eukprot:CAMPEP_0117475770 /NCGR_PEP_ID=MMETSP0784-20121206/9967_1 /TAXON_ID=39447 /ORGANISM="" /LENGTH=352 /DNA_ID=CAMNT_0005270029 /DNA_START=23 /DNA_END=1081 /DNA_ORIENTATION=-
MGKSNKRKLRGSGDSESFKKFKGGEDATDTQALRRQVDEDLNAARDAALEAQDGGGGDEVEDDADAEAAVEDSSGSDPYLMADAKYIQKDTRWKNKQRTLVFCSRGVTARFRHLSEDIKKMLPHHKTEQKFEKCSKLAEINEVCELKSCNNVIFFEARKGKDLYMWMARVPAGPTLKFQVLNIHTTAEVKLAGNCLLGSRPILQFDKHFNELAELKLMKTLMIQAFGTPRNHPKCKPFHDHVMSFYYLDKKIWFRHYQISPETPQDSNDPEKQVLTEIGPRFVLDPIRFLSGSFSGQTIFMNPHYFSPTALRSQAKKLLGNPYTRKLELQAEREERRKENEEPPDPLDEAFI